jgi:hypothetical protein
MRVPQGECWIRIIAKVTDTHPNIHSINEIADMVIYNFKRGVYFVIKAKPLTKQRGEGDILYRQCVQLFNRPYALVLYWNPHFTNPTIIEKIREAENNMKTNPRFEVVDKRFIQQIYNYYKNKIKK